MPYILIEGYECERCGYRWGSRNGTGFRDERDPNNCPECKSPYWNKLRKKKLPKEKQATRWSPEAKAEEAATRRARGGGTRHRGRPPKQPRGEPVAPAAADGP